MTEVRATNRAKIYDSDVIIVITLELLITVIVTTVMESLGYHTTTMVGPSKIDTRILH